MICRGDLALGEKGIYFFSMFNYITQQKKDMDELLKRRSEIIIKLNKAGQRLADEGDGFIDKKYIDEVLKWNEELKKIQAEIDRSSN